MAALHEVVLDRNFPDPTIVESDGKYYAYATQTPTRANVELAYSSDLINWEYIGDAMPHEPSWLRGRHFIWAPHIHYHNNQYLMYFSGEIEDSSNGEFPVFGIGLAYSDTPVGPFKDIGYPLTRGIELQDIDPMVFYDPVSCGNYLYYGSGWHSIRAVELCPEMNSFRNNPVDVLWPRDSQYEKLIEAAWVVYRNGWYFLFYSGDNATTWTPRPEYAIMIARSRSPLGPFERMGSPIACETKDYFAMGHNCIVTDSNNQDWMYYHGIDKDSIFIPGTDEVRRVMMRSPITYDDWPKIGYKKAV